MIKLNNSKMVIKKFEHESFPEQIPVVRIDESGVSQYPNITDSNIENNSKFILSIFDSELSDCKCKKKIKKQRKKF